MLIASVIQNNCVTFSIKAGYGAEEFLPVQGFLLKHVEYGKSVDCAEAGMSIVNNTISADM